MSNRPRGSIYTLVYAAALGMVCAAALTAAHELLAPYQRANAKALNVRKILTALDVPGAESATDQVASDLFANRVRCEESPAGTVYRYIKDDKLVGVAVRFVGPGYLAPIEGFLGLEPDLATIRVLTITSYGETPGLGGQIGSRQFQQQFKGKRVDGLRLVRGRGKRPLVENEVDAITGATRTSSRFQTILDETMPRIHELRKDVSE